MGAHGTKQTTSHVLNTQRHLVASLGAPAGPWHNPPFKERIPDAPHTLNRKMSRREVGQARGVEEGLEQWAHRGARVGLALERALWVPRPERGPGPEWTAWAPRPEQALERTPWAPGSERALERNTWAPGPERNAWAPGSERNAWAPGPERNAWAPGPERNAWAPGSERALEQTPWAPGSERALEQTPWAPGSERALERSGLSPPWPPGPPGWVSLEKSRLPVPTSWVNPPTYAPASASRGALQLWRPPLGALQLHLPPLEELQPCRPPPEAHQPP